MGQIARKYDFTGGTKAKSQEIDDELNQLVDAHNDLDLNKADKSAVLQKGDMTPFVPAIATDPANKQYVDQSVTAALLGVPPVGGVTPSMLSFNAADAGVTNASSDEIFSLFLPVDTRSLVPTAWDTDEHPTTLEIRSGATVLGTITITYNAEGKITQLALASGGRTITYTQTWAGAKFTGRTKAVV